MDEGLLREKAREAIQAGKLPRRAPDRLWGGLGRGETCVVCGDSLGQGQASLELEYTGHDHSEAKTSYVLHVRCFSAVELEHTMADLSRGSSADIQSTSDEPLLPQGPGNGTIRDREHQRNRGCT
jgi:hypothetical protein